MLQLDLKQAVFEHCTEKQRAQPWSTQCCGCLTGAQSCGTRLWHADSRKPLGRLGTFLCSTKMLVWGACCWLGTHAAGQDSSPKVYIERTMMPVMS